MDLEEALKIMDDEERMSPAVLWGGEASGSARSNTSRTYEEFQATLEYRMGAVMSMIDDLEATIREPFYF
ncbi:hypothetical protein TWF225_006230 [Orbilia oligospora]|nr:hypothetical protein TWF225_006230 [Orbilia oligospora]KAF3242329.1 hypothetical protein TWF128_010565 [Orbilia oligospora]KAF3246853.1 hypothetical protein TWF217_009869 [Orbilia oligospora]